MRITRYIIILCSSTALHFIIMSKKHLFNALYIIVLVIVTSFTAHAFSASNYASHSLLSKGRWIKIEIPEDGIYQITFDELADMGFSDPHNVRIYGHGGHPISEELDGSAMDDLVQVPFKISNDKIYFYGCGTVKFSLSNASTSPHFTRKFNSYSQKGYYFLTSDEASSRIEPSLINYGISGRHLRTSSLDYYHHEQEIVSASQSGKDMLGENFSDNHLTIGYNIPDLCTDSSIVVNTCVAVKSASNSYIEAYLNGDNIPFTISTSKVLASPSMYTFYNFASPYATFKTNKSIPSSGTLDININGSIKWAKLDYFTFTYYHLNTLKNATDNQLRMNFNNVSSDDIIAILDCNSSTEMWNIDNPNDPKSYSLNKRDELFGFTPLYASESLQFIAFDPTKPLKSISGYCEVANQDLHALSTPDMVIVTCEELIPQAERVAQLHRDNDNMTVHVIDQKLIFNEFSSGTPDAMAIRLMNKMFYDRNKNKFKYALMFGAGSQDNRQLLRKRPCTILTYESNGSNDESNSYVSDDFFGMLDDYSGNNPASEYMRLGVGRIPSASIEEAQSDVDKLINYVNNPDYGPWRNNALFVADYTADDTYSHASQAEGIGNIIVDEMGILLNKNKVFIKQYPVDQQSGFAYEARNLLNTQLKNGQYFMTYVGHGDRLCLTHDVSLWTINEAKKASYTHLPIVTTACCDVARYDGGDRGIMEILFHKPDGGVIAMVSTTRSAYSNGNDALNQAFVRNMFCFNKNGHMPTLGETYMLTKQSFGKTTNYNKMMFSLLGDPAMKLNYPKPYFKILKINGHTAGTNNIYSGQLQQITIQAAVYTADGTQVDNTFNGDATLSIYDMQKKETTFSNRDIFYPRNLLTQVSGRVVNGIFTCSTVIPRYTQYPGASGLISVYAHRDDSDEMVSGNFDKIVISSYNPNSSLTVHDDTPPVINAMYFDNEDDFDASNSTNAKSTLHIKATDDYGFNNQAIAIGNTMDLKIDGGKNNIIDVRSYATLDNAGKGLNVELPIELKKGHHTLQFTAHDMAGNPATRIIDVYVGNQQVTLNVEQEPATSVATFNINKTMQESNPEVKIMVFDSSGHYVWYTTTSTFPYEWDLKTRKGNKLPPGVYKFYGKYNDGINHGGTNTGTLIIAD